MGNKKRDALTQFNKSNILDSAKKLFVQKGVLQTTMDDIAKEADCSKSTIYVYFKSKDEIYNSIIYEYMILMKQGLSSCIALYKDYQDCYYAICNLLVSFKEKNPLYFESILGKISIKTDDMEIYPVLEEIYKVGEEINDIILYFFENAIKSRNISSETEPLPAVFVFWASISSIISIAYDKEEYFNKRLGMTKEEFLHYGFKLLLKSVQI